MCRRLIENKEDDEEGKEGLASNWNSPGDRTANITHAIVEKVCNHLFVLSTISDYLTEL